MRVSTTDIARAAAVSRTTASHVLNGRADVPIAAATRERVLAAARELGYRPNALARSLRSGRTYLIEVWVHSFFPSFFAQGIQALAEVVRETPYSLHLVPRPAWAGGPGRGDEAAAWPVDGILAFDADLRGDWVTRVVEHGVPFVDVSNFGPTATDWVGVDLRAGAVAATEHLLASGRRNVVFVAPEDVPDDARWGGYQQAMRAAGPPAQRFVPDPPGDPAQGGRDHCGLVRAGVASWLRDQPRPEALVCYSDECALGALRALADLGLRVPADVAVVGCDDIAAAEFAVPSLTTLRYPFYDVARLAWEFLSRRIAEPDTPRQRALLTPALIVRESSAMGART